MKLTPKNYFKTVNDNTKLQDLVILCPLEWLVADLTDKKPIKWRAARSLIYREGNYDIVNCTPGSIAVATLSEIKSAGAKKVIFIGTGGGLQNQEPGTLLHNPKSISVINPYWEHEDWDKIKDFDIVDMESSWLSRVNIPLDIHLIVADRVYEHEWQPLELDDKYKAKHKENIKKLKEVIEKSL